jgi:hypothetical protein
VTETAARTECLDERVPLIWFVARQRALQLRMIVTILRLQRRDAERSERIAEVFWIAPFEDARKRQLVRGGLDCRTVPGLPCRRDWNPDLSGGGVGSRFVEHYGKLGRSWYQGLQTSQTTRIGRCADHQQISLGDREQKLRVLIGSDPVQKFDCQRLVGRTEVTSRGPFE